MYSNSHCGCHGSNKEAQHWQTGIKCSVNISVAAGSQRQDAAAALLRLNTTVDVAMDGCGKTLLSLLLWLRPAASFQLRCKFLLAAAVLAALQ